MPAPNRPMTPYDVIGLIKAIRQPGMEKAGLVTKQAILINVLLKFINNPAITSAVWEAGLEGLSEELKTTIGK